MKTGRRIYVDASKCEPRVGYAGSVVIDGDTVTIEPHGDMGPDAMTVTVRSWANAIVHESAWGIPEEAK